MRSALIASDCADSRCFHEPALVGFYLACSTVDFGLAVVELLMECVAKAKVNIQFDTGFDFVPWPLQPVNKKQA